MTRHVTERCQRNARSDRRRGGRDDGADARPQPAAARAAAGAPRAPRTHWAPSTTRSRSARSCGTSSAGLLSQAGDLRRPPRAAARGPLPRSGGVPAVPRLRRRRPAPARLRVRRRPPAAQRPGVRRSTRRSARRPQRSGACYVVEVCVDCSWNHLAEAFLMPLRRLSARTAEPRTLATSTTSSCTSHRVCQGPVGYHRPTWHVRTASSTGRHRRSNGSQPSPSNAARARRSKPKGQEAGLLPPLLVGVRRRTHRRRRRPSPAPSTTSTCTSRSRRRRPARRPPTSTTGTAT